MTAPAALPVSEIIEQFRRAMADYGLPYSRDNKGGIQPDTDTIQRYHVEGDKKKSLNGWYILYTDGKVPAGEFGSWKAGKQVTWTAIKTEQMSEEERAAHAEQIAKTKAKREAEQKARYDRASQSAQAMWDAASECTTHPYLLRKGVGAHGVRIGRWYKADEETGEIWLDVPNALLVPIRKSAKRLAGLQAIFDSKHPKIGRDKDFLAGSEKRGCYHTIGQLGPDTSTVVICEGYATGATIHEATGWPVVIALDAGNLQPVAEKLRKALPDARVVYGADNDQWTDEPVKNPGVYYARQAAKKTGGDVLVPQFTEAEIARWREENEKGQNEGPTDWNDKADLSGADDVRNAFMPPANDNAQPANDNTPAPAPAPAPRDHVGMDYGNPYSYFTVLGYNREDIYIFQQEARQLLVFNRRDLSTNALLSLAPLQAWCTMYPAKTGFEKDVAVDELIRNARRLAVFNPGRIRGRGAWTDANRSIFHFGDFMRVDGVDNRIGRLKSKFIYQAEVPFSIDDSAPAMSRDEGFQLLDLAFMFKWTVPASAALLAGWTALAPLCGALRWRPHIWITGGAGCGKSTILEQYVNTLTRWCNVYAQGNSTEAGIRQTLQCDAVPVLFDETEQNNERESQRMQSVLALIRQASSESGAKTLKGTTQGSAMNFHIRSMFCLASIQVGIQQQADRERLTVLSLRSNKHAKDSAEAAAAKRDWDEIKERFYLMQRDEALPARLFNRMLGMLPTVLKSVDVFVAEAAKHFGSQRDGDQYGTLLAGCWCLTNDHPPRQEDARAMITSFDWTEYAEGTVEDDATRALNTLMQARIRTIHGSEYTVYELADAVGHYEGIKRSNPEPPSCQMEQRDIQATLQRAGMKVHKGVLMIACANAAVGRLYAGTPYQADFKGLLSRVPGVVRDAGAVWISGSTARCLGVPLDMIL